MISPSISAVGSYIRTAEWIWNARKWREKKHGHKCTNTKHVQQTESQHTKNHIHYMEIVQFFIHKHLTAKIVAYTSAPFVVNSSRHDLARSLTCYCRLISVCICYVVVAAFFVFAHIVAINCFFFVAQQLHSNRWMLAFLTCGSKHNGYCAKIHWWKNPFHSLLDIFISWA